MPAVVDTILKKGGNIGLRQRTIERWQGFFLIISGVEKEHARQHAFGSPSCSMAQLRVGSHICLRIGQQIDGFSEVGCYLGVYLFGLGLRLVTRLRSNNQRNMAEGLHQIEIEISTQEACFALDLVVALLAVEADLRQRFKQHIAAIDAFIVNFPKVRKHVIARLF